VTGTSREQLRIGLSEGDGATVVRLAGDAGFRHADRLADALAAAAARRPRAVVFDLSRLGFISSLAIGVLVTFKYRLARQGGAMALVGVPPRVEQALRLARVFDDVIMPNGSGSRAG
jgi:anti-anti-sigma factor